MRTPHPLPQHNPTTYLSVDRSTGSTQLEYGHQFDYFDPAKFTLVSWDAPGFGQSRPLERDYRDCYERDARLLVELMSEHVGVDRFHLLGFSDGGRTAITLSSCYPDRVAKLVLVGTTSFNSPKERRVFDLCRDVEAWSSDRRSLYQSVYGQQLQSVWAR